MPQSEDGSYGEPLQFWLGFEACEDDPKALAFRLANEKPPSYPR